MVVITSVVLWKEYKEVDTEAINKIAMHYGYDKQSRQLERMRYK